MELTILGSGGGFALAGRAASGYLLRHEGFDLWVDAGTGCMANLQEHVGLLDVDAIVISHRHFDHFLDIYPYFLARWLHPERPPKVPFFAPPGMWEHALQLEESLGITFDPHEVELGTTFEVGPFKIRTAPMAHPVPTLGMRIEADGAALAYTADTGPNDRMVELARGADLLLSEATYLVRPPDIPYELHLTAAEAGEHARRADVGRLMLTHIWPLNDREASLTEAAATFTDGDVSLAMEGTATDV